MKKSTIAIIVIILFLLAGVYLFIHNKAVAPSQDENSSYQNPSTPAITTGSEPNTQANVKAAAGADYTPPQSSTGGETTGSNIQVTEVDFNGSQFRPNPAKINVGDYIFFKNKGTDSFWPLAGSANTVAAYPTFNAGNPIAPGGEYKFQFTKAGNFSYGDNLHPNAAATVEVGN
jgi:plastocyanin